MPPKKVAALAQAVKDRVTRKTAAKKPAAKKGTATKKTAGAANAAAAGAITAENNPVAAAPKRALKTAGKAPARRANISKKRKSKDEDDDDEEENEVTPPPAKKAKTTTARAAAPKKAKAPVKKTAAQKKKATGNNTTASKATASKKRKAADEDNNGENDDDDAAPKPKKAKKTVANKRKAADEDENEDEDGPKTKKAKTSNQKNTAAAPEKAAAAPKKKAAPKAKATVPKKKTTPAAPPPPTTKKVKIGPKINSAPTQPLDIFVFGEGSAGELGLGSRKAGGKMPIDVKRPRLNPNLSGPQRGVVQFACGGMHGIALTRDNKVLTWGVNDNGALGRETKWDGGLRDAYPDPEASERVRGGNGSEQQEGKEGDGEDEDEDEDEDSGLNPYESTPAEIDMRNVAPGTKFVQVAASDSASFALTEDGRIYSWGTFRATEGVLGFDPSVTEQFLPVLLPEPRKITSLATGTNHVLALDTKGKIHTWGAGEQSQLGRRVVERDARASSLRPGGLPRFPRGVRVARVAAGSYHSFAVTADGRVYAWGLNNFGELGVEENMGVDGATVLPPTLVEGLLPHRVVEVAGGEHHSVARTDGGQVLVWGRMDGNQCGLARGAYDRENSLFDEAGRPRILRVPTAHDEEAFTSTSTSSSTSSSPTSSASGAASASAIAVGTDTSIVVTAGGEAWSWGFNTTYQCGQGQTPGEVFPPRRIDNSVVRGRKIVAAGCGGQFSMLASRCEEE